MEYCVTGKIQHKTEKLARTHVMGLSKSDKRHKYRFYKCEHCGFFHAQTVKVRGMGESRRIKKYPKKFIEDIINTPLRPIPSIKKNKKQNKKRGKKR